MRLASVRVRASVLLPAAALLLVLAFQSGPPPSDSVDLPTWQVSVPYWVSSSTQDSVLILNNARNEERAVRLLLFDSSGRQLAGEELGLSRHKSRF